MKLITLLFALLFLVACTSAPDAGGDPQITVAPTENVPPPVVTEPPEEPPVYDTMLTLRQNFVEFFGITDIPTPPDFPDWEEVLALDRVQIALYFGTFSGREVVKLHPLGAIDLPVYTKTVAGYEFEFGHTGQFPLEEDGVHDGTGVPVWVHDNGNFMCICEAYEDGLLSAEDIGVIWEQWNEYLGVE